MIFWVNGEWVELSDDDDEDDEPTGGNIKAGLNIRFDSSLEVIYSPQRIHVIGNTEKTDLAKDESDINRLEAMLKKAIETENFELATKIKDLLALQNGEASEDK